VNNNEFDKRIADIVAGEDIPFNEDNWAAMQHMLGKKGPRKLLLLPFLLNPYSAAAAVFLIIITSVYFLVNQPVESANDIVTTHQPAVEHIPVDELPDTASYNITPLVNATPKQKVKKRVAEVEQPVIAAHITTEDSSMPVKKTVVAQEPKPHKADKQLRDYFPVSDDEDARHNKLVFGINSGVALYESNNSFTAGLLVKNRINEKLSVQVGLSFVQGRQNISSRRVDVAEHMAWVNTDTGMVPGLATTVTERYEEYSRNLPYIQFNPSVSVKIFRKLYGAVGADVQRLIINKTTLDTMNKHLGEAGRKVPQTDAGITLNMGYNITKNIGFGISYRSSLAGVATGKVQYVKRNYFLVQLQYLFNAE